MKPVLLIGDSPVGDSPYISSYIEILENNNIPYELVYWNRHLDSIKQLPGNYIPYNCYTEIMYPNWKKMIKIWGFARFAKKQMQSKRYAYVVVFTIAHAVFMYSTLKKYYKGKYIFDIRDYSPMCDVEFIKKIITKLIEYSSFTAVSSAGFLRWLPKGAKFRYVIAHNTKKEMIKKYSEAEEPIKAQWNKDNISILTIGQIRDVDANTTIMEAFKDEKTIKIVFAGYGFATETLKEYAKQHHINNVYFTGKYIKDDEESIVRKHQFMNTFLNSDINSDTLMSNRFYLSVLMRKPLITNKGSFQASLAEKYGLGVVLNCNDNFVEKIKKYMRDFDEEKYN